MTPPLFGLVLAGGASARMQRDKAALRYHGKPQLDWAFDLLQEFCPAVFVSVRADQRDDATRARFPQIVDREAAGPLAGVLAALQQHPKAAWLVLACDLPFLTAATLRRLIEARDPQRMATAYRSAHDGLPEPLCAIWEPAAHAGALAYSARNGRCPRKFLSDADVRLLDLDDPRALDNVNTAEEFDAASAVLSTASAPSEHAGGAEQRGDRALRKQIHVQYFAVLREQAGRADETLQTTAATPAELYEELRVRHAFQLAPTQLRVALNAEFSDWRAPLKENDAVVFIPPVAGG